MRWADWTIRVLVCAVLVAGCGGSGGDDGGAVLDETDSPTSSQVAKPSASPELVGEPVVIAADYGLPNTTGWSTSVAFRVKNQSDDVIVGERYRVTVKGGSGKTLGTTDGTDTFTLMPNEERWVVADPDDPEGERPTTATVTFYNPTPDTQGGTPADPSDWTVDNGSVVCDEGVVECEANADLTYRADAAQGGVEVTVIVHSSSLGGPVVGAGVLDLSEIVEPNTPTPWSLATTVVDPEHEGDDFVLEWRVDSVDAVGD